MIKLLIDSGADVNYAPNPLMSPLRMAATIDAIKTLQLLIDAGVDLNEGFAERDVYTFALTFVKSDEALDFLLKKGVNPNVYLDYLQDTPYIFSLIHSKSYSKLAVVLKNGADPDIRGKISKATPLHLAAGYNDIEAVKLLLQYGANKNNFDLHLNTPLDVARELNHEELIELLK